MFGTNSVLSVDDWVYANRRLVFRLKLCSGILLSFGVIMISVFSVCTFNYIRIYLCGWILRLVFRIHAFNRIHIIFYRSISWLFIILFMLHSIFIICIVIQLGILLLVKYIHYIFLHNFLFYKRKIRRAIEMVCYLINNKVLLFYSLHLTHYGHQ